MNSQVPDSAHSRWLLEELPLMEARGLIDSETAKKLRAHYASQLTIPRRVSLALVICGVLGAALIGFGVILLLAHNWDHWSRATRMVMSFMPLLLTQVITLYVLVRQASSVAWRESAALAHMLSVAASIALIGQTYHLPGDLEAFLLSWMLLSLPLVYLLNASITGAACAIGIAAWAADSGHQLAGYLGLMALLLPHLAYKLREDRHSLSSTILLWSYASSLTAASMIALDREEDLWPLTLGGLSAAYYLADARWFTPTAARMLRPLGTLGLFGIALISLVLASGEWWPSSEFRTAGYTSLNQAAVWLLNYGSVIAALFLWALACTKRDLHTLAYGALPLVYLISISTGSKIFGLVTFNLYALALGILSLRRGLQQNSLSTLNFGLLLILALGLIRFLNSDFPYWLRGLAFVIAGIGFLVANVYLKRRSAS